jgi:hypothetical protein
MSGASSQFVLSRGAAGHMLVRVVAALIVIGVIAFLAFDAYVLYRVFKGRAAADDFGSLPIPGETEITVPAGKVKISYQEAYKAAGGGDGPIDFYVPAVLQVEVKRASGEPLEIKGPGFRGRAPPSTQEVAGAVPSSARCRSPSRAPTRSRPGRRSRAGSSRRS